MLKWINNSLNLSPASEAKQNHYDPFVQQNLAGQILELEFECESEAACKELIGKLIRLYTTAVEYYEDRNDSRYLAYKKRMESFLKKESIDEILRGKSGQLVSLKDTAEKRISQAITKSRNEANKLILRTDKIETANRFIVESSLNRQEAELSERIQRRKAMSNCSTRTKDDEEEGKTVGKRMDMQFLLEGIYQRNGRGNESKKRVFI